MKNIRKQPLKEKGITLVALVVTIIVLLILAGISLGMATGNNGIIQRAKDAKATHEEGEANDTKTIAGMSDYMNEKLGKTGLSEDKVALVNNKIREATTLQQLQVAYEAKEITDDETSVAGKGRSVIVEGAYSGTGTDQTFYQSYIGAIGSRKLNWYVLSADENGVNLVSDETRKDVIFKDSPGYDNCLYYLNELSTKLFANDDLGITENRIHALRLTDIKKAAEQVNVNYKVNDNGIERDWSWDLDVIKDSRTNVYNNGNVGQLTFTPNNKYYPAIYTADSNKEVVASNPMYDETPKSKITTDGGIKRNTTDNSNPANKLTLNETAFASANNETTLRTLGKFGDCKVGRSLFNTVNSCYFATRCIGKDSGFAYFGLQIASNGIFNYCSMGRSNGISDQSWEAFRVVISVPGNKVDIADDGTVTIKQANS